MVENHTPQKTNTKLLTKGEVATKFSVTIRTIDRWMMRGRIKFVKAPGGGVRFRENDVLDALDRDHDERNGRGPVTDPSMG